MDIIVGLLFLSVIATGLIFFRHSDHQPHLPESRLPISEFVPPPYAMSGTTVAVLVRQRVAIPITTEHDDS